MIFNFSDASTALTVSQDIDFLSTTFTVFLSFLLSTLVAYVYVWTLQKSTYSRNYLQSIVLISIIACVIILSVGDSIARGVGIMAAVGIIRFRTNFKNPRDTIFLFAALAAGIACGANAFIVAIEGTLCFALASMFLRYASFSPIAYYDCVISFQSNSTDQSNQIDRIMQAHCKKFVLIHAQENAKGVGNQYDYHIKRKKNVSNTQLIEALKAGNFAQKIVISEELDANTDFNDFI